MVVKVVYMAVIFCAYSVAKVLPAAVFLFAVKARWVWLGAWLVLMATLTMT